MRALERAEIQLDYSLVQLQSAFTSKQVVSLNRLVEFGTRTNGTWPERHDSASAASSGADALDCYAALCIPSLESHS